MAIFSVSAFSHSMHVHERKKSLTANIHTNKMMLGPIIIRLLDKAILPLFTDSAHRDKAYVLL